MNKFEHEKREREEIKSWMEDRSQLNQFQFDQVSVQEN